MLRRPAIVHLLITSLLALLAATAAQAARLGAFPRIAGILPTSRKAERLKSGNAEILLRPPAATAAQAPPMTNARSPNPLPTPRHFAGQRWTINLPPGAHPRSAGILPVSTPRRASGASSPNDQCPVTQSPPDSAPLRKATLDIRLSAMLAAPYAVATAIPELPAWGTALYVHATGAFVTVATNPLAQAGAVGAVTAGTEYLEGESPEDAAAMGLMNFGMTRLGNAPLRLPRLRMPAFLATNNPRPGWAPGSVINPSGKASGRPATTKVTSWAEDGITPDLNPGRWVVKGDATKWNFFKTGLWGQFKLKE